MAYKLYVGIIEVDVLLRNLAQPKKKRERRISGQFQSNDGVKEKTMIAWHARVANA